MCFSLTFKFPLSNAVFFWNFGTYEIHSNGTFVSLSHFCSYQLNDKTMQMNWWMIKIIFIEKYKDLFSWSSGNQNIWKMKWIWWEKIKKKILSVFEVRRTSPKTSKLGKCCPSRKSLSIRQFQGFLALDDSQVIIQESDCKVQSIKFVFRFHYYNFQFKWGVIFPRFRFDVRLVLTSFDPKPMTNWEILWVFDLSLLFSVSINCPKYLFHSSISMFWTLF